MVRYIAFWRQRKNSFDPRAFLTPIMDTVMYGVIPDEDVAALMAVVEKGVKEAIRYSDRRIWFLMEKHRWWR